MHKRFVPAVIIGMLLIFIVGAAAAASQPVRLGGPNRYATAAAISAFDRSYSGYAVLARGDHYADALAGVPLATLYQGPILLTPVNALAPETREELEALAAHTVFILGGVAAIGPRVEQELVDMGLAVERIEGANRFATAAAIALKVAPNGAETAVVASGRDFPDALAAAAYAGARGYPILLTEKDELPPETAAALAALGVVDTVLAGGPAVIPDRVANLLPACARVSGADRFQTAVALARYFQPAADGVFIANGRSFADAITGAALAARRGCGLLLTDRTLPAALTDYLNAPGLESIYLLGGAGVISSEQEQELAAMLSLTGKRVEFLDAAVMTSEPGGGEALRHPYPGFVTNILGTAGDYARISFGSKTGWVPKQAVVQTEKAVSSLRLGWQFTRPQGKCFVDRTPDISGFNIYAPVSYAVNGASLRRLVNLETEMELARQNGYWLWLTVQQSGANPNFSAALIAEIIDRALVLDVDGVNIDFEGMGEANRAGLTEFMSRLYPRAKAHGLTVSIAVNCHANNRYGLSFDRPALVPYCDYMALMAYEQTGSGGPAGPTAPFTWVESSLQLLLQEVPAAKVLLGVPFYTRNWSYASAILAPEASVLMLETMRLRSEPSTAGGSATVIYTAQAGEYFPYRGEVAGESILGESKWYMLDLGGQSAYVSGYTGYTRYLAKGEVYGKAGLSSYALPLQAGLDIRANYDPATASSRFTTQAGKTVEMRQVQIGIDEARNQTKVTYIDAAGQYNEIWLEDFASLRRRWQLAEEYGLAGLAAWSLDWLDNNQQAWSALD